MDLFFPRDNHGARKCKTKQKATTMINSTPLSGVNSIKAVHVYHFGDFRHYGLPANLGGALIMGGALNWQITVTTGAGGLIN